jgi:hypothetical protein
MNEQENKSIISIFKKHPHWLNRLALALVITGIFGMYLAGLAAVPFHPDEATQIFMSSDLEKWVQAPLSLAWQPDQPLDPRMRYRLLDAPLTRYLIGFQRLFTGQPALPADWDWSKTWDENKNAGALPSPGLLFLSRLTLSGFFPLSLLLIYKIGRLLHNRLTGWLAVLLLASNALVLLHTRRAMTEAPLLCGCLVLLWVILRHPKQGWLVGLLAGLAFNAKQAVLPLVVLAGVVVFYQSLQAAWRKRFTQIAAFGLTFCLISFLLNPFLWLHPLQSAQAALQERQNLTQAQVRTLSSVRPDLALPTVSDRAAVLLVQLFFTPPATSDIGNYLNETRASDQAYLAQPGHTFLRSLPAGAFLFMLTLAGMFMALLLLKPQRLVLNPQKISGTLKDPGYTSFSSLWLLAATGAEFMGLSLFAELPFQRYCLPLIPFVCLWSAFALSQLSKAFYDKRGALYKSVRQV